VVEISDLFYNDDLREFERLNVTTENIYDLGKYANLIILKNGENHTDFLSVDNLEDIIFISQDVSGIEDLSNKYCLENKLSLKRHENPLKNVKAMVVVNVSDKATSLEYMFCNLKNLKTVSGLETWDTSNASSMRGMFSDCINLKTIHGLDCINPQKAESLRAMFHKCKKLNDASQISKWDVSNVNDMQFMFSDCVKMESLPPIGEWMINPNCSFSRMFDGCSLDLRMEFYSNWRIGLKTHLKRSFRN